MNDEPGSCRFCGKSSYSRLSPDYFKLYPIPPNVPKWFKECFKVPMCRIPGERACAPCINRFKEYKKFKDDCLAKEAEVRHIHGFTNQQVMEQSAKEEKEEKEIIEAAKSQGLRIEKIPEVVKLPELKKTDINIKSKFKKRRRTKAKLSELSAQSIIAKRELLIKEHDSRGKKEPDISIPEIHMTSLDDLEPEIQTNFEEMPPIEDKEESENSNLEPLDDLEPEVQTNFEKASFIEVKTEPENSSPEPLDEFEPEIQPEEAPFIEVKREPEELESIEIKEESLDSEELESVEIKEESHDSEELESVEIKEESHEPEEPELVEINEESHEPDLVEIKEESYEPEEPEPKKIKLEEPLEEIPINLEAFEKSSVITISTLPETTRPGPHRPRKEKIVLKTVEENVDFIPVDVKEESPSKEIPSDAPKYSRKYFEQIHKNYKLTRREKELSVQLKLTIDMDEIFEQYNEFMTLNRFNQQKLKKCVRICALTLFGENPKETQVKQLATVIFKMFPLVYDDTLLRLEFVETVMENLKNFKEKRK